MRTLILSLLGMSCSKMHLFLKPCLEKCCSLVASHLRGIVPLFLRPLYDPIWGHFHPPELLVPFIHQHGWLTLAVQDRSSGAMRPTQRTRSSPARVGGGLQEEVEEEEERDSSVQWDKWHTVNQLICASNWICDIGRMSGLTRRFSCF